MRFSNLLLGFCGGFLFARWLQRRAMESQLVPYAPVSPPALPPILYLAHQPDWQDAIRADFLRRLDTAPVVLSDWELRFLENNIGRTCYTARQRSVIDQMRRKYERRF
jgi:hypothetical protein